MALGRQQRHRKTCCAPRRERADVERRFRDQVAALNGRVAELDTDNRKLRDTKYELDTKVGSWMGL